MAKYVGPSSSCCWFLGSIRPPAEKALHMQVRYIEQFDVCSCHKSLQCKITAWILEPLVSESWPLRLWNHTLIDQLLHHSFHHLVLFRGCREKLLHAESISRRRALMHTHTHGWETKVSQHNHVRAWASGSKNSHAVSSSDPQVPYKKCWISLQKSAATCNFRKDV